MKCFERLSVFIIIFCTSCIEKDEIGRASSVRNQSLITLEIFPINDVIYKISDDLNFENWNFGILVKGLDSEKEIDRLQIKHYSGQDQIYLVEYSSNSLSEFLNKRSDGEIVFHNFHIMLPENLSADNLKIEIFSKTKILGQKSVKLLRYKQQNQYRLPFSGTWFVSSGHDFGVEHRRHLSRGQFAWDFVLINEKGQVSSGSGLEDNFSYGQPVLAPASGVVVDVENGQPDNELSVVDRSYKANYVEIEHGNGEISRTVHLKNGSIQVSIGDSVISGQFIGSVGNSGNSDTPHLHIGFQTNIPAGIGGVKQIPIPILFSNYRVSWNQGIDLLVSKGRPRRGQFLSQD